MRVVGALGGATITALFKTGELFGAYCIGLFVGFFLYFVISLFLKGDAVSQWMGS